MFGNVSWHKGICLKIISLIKKNYRVSMNRIQVQIHQSKVHI